MVSNVSILSPAFCKAAVRAVRASGMPMPVSTKVQPWLPVSAYMLTVRNGKGIGSVIFQMPATTSRASGNGSGCRAGCPGKDCCIEELSFVFRYSDYDLFCSFLIVCCGGRLCQPPGCLYPGCCKVSLRPAGAEEKRDCG